jgi:hypothetical protein
MGGARSTNGGDEKCMQKFSQKTLMEEAIWETGIDGKIVLTEMLRRWDVRVWSGFNRLMIRCVEHGNESAGSVKDEKCLGQFSEYLLFKRDSCSVEIIKC